MTTEQLRALYDRVHPRTLRALHLEGGIHRIETDEGRPAALVQWGAGDDLAGFADLVAAAVNALPRHLAVIEAALYLEGALNGPADLTRGGALVNVPEALHEFRRACEAMEPTP